MNNLDPVDNGPTPASVRLPDGQISFARSNSTKASLRIVQFTSAVHVDLTQQSLEEGLDKACAKEIDQVRTSLESLGLHLASRLSDEGRTPVVSRTWRNNEERTWSDHGSALVIQPTTFRLHEELNGYEGASDSELVHAHIRLLIQQRVENIRMVYRQILNDVRQRCPASRPSKTENRLVPDSLPGIK